MLIWLQNVYLARTWRVWFLYFSACEQLARRRNTISKTQAPAVYKYAHMQHSRGPSESEFDVGSRRESISSLEEMSTPRTPSCDSPRHHHHQHHHHHRSISRPKAHNPSLPPNLQNLQQIERPRSVSPGIGSGGSVSVYSTTGTGTGGGDTTSSRSGHATPRSKSMGSVPLPQTAYEPLPPMSISIPNSSSAHKSSISNHSRKSTPFRHSQNQSRPSTLKQPKAPKKKKPHWLKKRSTWFVDHKYLVKQRNMVRFCATVTLAEWIGPITTFALSSRSSDFIEDAIVCPSLDASLLLLTLYIGTFCTYMYASSLT